ncbi:hypothetical protein M8Z33_29145 [Streptomyces sp. ZAF1911]|uniref:hypothetical protein n=1 Tax=Streptomyces sp. ZAF1911 TaxID=2944129 RepID=UPI00237BC34C|nr:hypothetical protein [Streptomyces sp. ZAF1911]MDD9380649.1 hypothetical protein [Streptomyces sp. ZAF1911]
MRSLSLPHTMRTLVRAGSVPVLLLAATATAGAAAVGGAYAADGPTAALGTPTAHGPAFQYLGTDDRPHGIDSPRGCVEALGGGGRAVSNKTGRSVALYREPGCVGTPVEVLAPGTVKPVPRYFSSARFSAGS